MYVREFREDQAATQIKKQRAKVVQAENFVQQKQKELKDYIEWRVRREQEMYDEIMKQPIHMKELEKVKESVQMLKANEAGYQDAVLQAQSQLETERQQLEEDTAAHRVAVKETDKLKEHRAIWQAAASKEEEFNQEKELEDFRTREEEFDDDDYETAEIT